MRDSGAAELASLQGRWVEADWHQSSQWAAATARPQRLRSRGPGNSNRDSGTRAKTGPGSDSWDEGGGWVSGQDT